MDPRSHRVPAEGPAARLAERHITDRFMPDKAIDLMDEAAAQLRITIDSLPPELDQVERKTRQLGIERTALSTEKGKGSERRIEEIGRELAQLEEKGRALKTRWQTEKDLITAIRAGRTLIETLRAEAERREREGDFERVAKIRNGELYAGDTAVVDFEGGVFRLTGQHAQPEPAGAAS